MMTSSAPRRRASSFLCGEVVKTTTLRAEGAGELDPHVPQAAETDHADLLPLDVAPAAHRRVGGDPGAEQRRDPGELQVGGNAQHEALVDDDALRVAAVGDRRRAVLVRGVVGEGGIRAELLDVGPATRAVVVRIDQAADADQVARLELGDSVPTWVTRPTISCPGTQG